MKATLIPLREQLRRIGSSEASKRNSRLLSALRSATWPLVRPYLFFIGDRIETDQTVSTEYIDRVLAETERALAETERERERANAVSEREHIALRRSLSDAQTQVRSLEHELAQVRGGFDERMRDFETRFEARLRDFETRLAEFRQGSGKISLPLPGIRRAELAGLPWHLFFNRLGTILLQEGDFISVEFEKNDGWDRHLEPVIKAAARRGRIAIDAGAHIGLITREMAASFGLVHAFEPNSQTYLALAANAALAPAVNVVPYRLALYSRETQLSLAGPEAQEIPIPTDSLGAPNFRGVENSGAMRFFEQGSGQNLVEARTLDSFGFNDVGLIKVDCQGADGEVIRGAVGTIRRCQPFVVFEWEAQLSKAYETDLPAIKTLFASLGYEVQVLHVHNDKQTDYLARPLPA
jgi:FkbM family methyltransferase